MTRSHKHHCANREHGCDVSWECSAPLIDNYDGWPEVLCAEEEAAGTVDIECQACRDARCEECGALLNLQQPHDVDCSENHAGAEEEDNRTWGADSFQYRQSEAMRVKR